MSRPPSPAPPAASRPAGLREKLRRDLQAVERSVRRLVDARPAVPEPRMSDRIRKEWSPSPAVNLSSRAIRPQEINRLYELRSQLLDWTVETGFLGFFHPNPGTRYIYTRRLEVLYELLPPLQGKRVLEIGCAAGILAALLAPRCRSLTGIDVTETALKFGRQLHRDLRQFNTRLLLADAHDLPFPDRSFDLIVSMETLEHLLNPDRALSEFRRVLTAEGEMVLTTTTAATPSDLAVKLLRLFKRDFYVDSPEQFDKKAYWAARHQGLKVRPEAFRRVHHRFGYRQLVRRAAAQGFAVEQAKGAVLALPPVYLAVYPFLPAWTLPLVRWGEELGNELEFFKRFGAVTTAFRFRRR